MSRELLQQALEALSGYRDYLEEELLQSSQPTDLEKAIEAELARNEWVKFTDALPVVSHEASYVGVWLYRSAGRVIQGEWYRDFLAADACEFTHWCYRQIEQAPQPPRSESWASTYQP